MKRTVYRDIASAVDARLRCITDKERMPHLAEWIDKHADRAEELTKRFLPSGSGFNSGTTIELDASTGERLVFNTSFHHMNNGGYYDGWTEHQVIVTPSLVHTIVLRITGRNRNDIKDYISGAFHAALTETFDE